jgi:hypothetical protein
MAVRVARGVRRRVQRARRRRVALVEVARADQLPGRTCTPAGNKKGSKGGDRDMKNSIYLNKILFQKKKLSIQIQHYGRMKHFKS